LFFVFTNWNNNIAFNIEPMGVLTDKGINNSIFIKKLNNSKYMSKIIDINFYLYKKKKKTFSIKQNYIHLHKNVKTS
jgi:hypothetical protein